MKEATAAFWRRYVSELPDAHAHRSVRPDVFAFGDSPDLADGLAALVLSGRKRATTSLPIEFTHCGDPLPVVGGVSIVTTSDGHPVAIIEVTQVRHIPFTAVDETFAAAEGEGDGSLAWWRAAHRRYFTRVCDRLGGSFDDATVVICQEFRLLWSG